MVTWEYMYTHNISLENMNVLGAEGWEAVEWMAGGYGMLLRRDAGEARKEKARAEAAAAREALARAMISARELLKDAQQRDELIRAVDRGFPAAQGGGVAEAGGGKPRSPDDLPYLRGV